MKEPSVSRFRKKLASKLKFVCSFNGAFLVRPPSNKLRYVGGETRIISVDRIISFSKLRSKISDMCHNTGLFSIKYQLLNPDLGQGDDTPLVLITSDDDVRCMVEEYDKLELYGKGARLWLFVCAECDDNNSNNNGFLNGNGGCCISGGRLVDDSLRKKVLKQQLLAKQCSENQKYEHPLIDLGLDTEPNISMIKNDPFRGNMLNEMRNVRPRPLNPRDGNVTKGFVGTNASMECLTRRAGQGLCDGSRTTTGTLSSPPLKEVYKCGMPSTCNSLDAKQEFRNIGHMPVSNFNRENIMPWAMSSGSMNNNMGSQFCSKQCVGSAYPVKSSYVRDRVSGNCQNGINSHRFGVNDSRYQRIYLYYLRNHRNNLIEVGNHRGFRLDRKIPEGKCYLGIRPNSYMPKQVQYLGSYSPNSLNPGVGFTEHASQEGVSLTGSFFGKGISSLDVQISREKFGEPGRPTVLEYGNSNREESHLAYHDVRNGASDQSFLSGPALKSPSAFVRVLSSHEDLSTGSNFEKREVQYQTHRMPINCETVYCDLENENFLVDSCENSDIGLSDDTDYRNGTELGCSVKNSAKNFQSRVTSSMDLLYNLSLSSSQEIEPPRNSSFAGDAISDALFKPQSKPLDRMGEGRFMTGPTVVEPNRVKSKFSFHNDATGRIDEHKEEIQPDAASGLSLEEKVDTKKSYKCAKVTGGNSHKLTDFCTTGELQTIKTSDLEYVKELGSGMFGTVFYGKWKGSDVAIKKMKPRCFTEGSLEEDRLVADFWREAHILGQLHHPNVVAFYGVVTDGPVTNLATVTEYMVNGSLKQVLRRKDGTIDRRKRLIIAMDAAFGMEYLHEKNIVHFDLKSHNFLVNMRDPQRPVCKIGDLGLSKIKQKTLISGGVRGTIPWMAPELLNTKNNLVTEKIDVYSFGIVMWELLTGEEPYVDLHSEEIIAGIIKGSLRPEIPSWCNPTWRLLMERCWSSDPNSRPAFSEIAKELRTMAEAMNIK